MGRKSTSKVQARGSVTPPPDEPTKSPPLLIVAIVALIAAVGVFAFVRSSSTVQPETSTPRASAPPASAAPTAAEPAFAKFGPHTQARLPPLPFSPVPMSRPPDVVNAAYKFAAEHPEVLAYVPCYCGCENSGHKGNDDCFVAARASNGDVTEWEPHGMT